MAQWIKLTLTTNGQALYINLDQAATIEPAGNGGSIVTLTSGRAFVVIEQPDNIISALGV